jgi:hypothetical protein
MKKTALATVLSGILTSLWLGVPACAAQAAGAAVPAPVPGQIANAKSVFISNMGVDAVSLAAFKREQAPDKPYGEFYAAMKAWGRYELVDNPADADLVFEVGFMAPLAGAGNSNTYSPQLKLAIVDAKTHFTLWTLTEPVEGAIRRGTWDKNFGAGLASLMEDLKRLSAPTGAASGAVKQ